MSDMTRAPIRSACWRVHLIGGVERQFFWWVVLVAFAACGVSWLSGAWYLTWFIVPASVAIIEVCRRATLEDPMALRVWLRWVFEPNRVPASGRFDSQPHRTTRLR